MSAESDYIVSAAKKRNLDPLAVLAVASHEGVTIPSQIGDNGTSFGPWQLHIGGAFPLWAPHDTPTAANQWANSKAGIDYALDRIASVAGGESGAQAVRDIVYRFERPKDPAGEYTRALSTYQQSAKLAPTLAKGPGGGGSPFNYNPLTGFGIPNAIGQGIKSAENAVVGPVEKAVLRGLFIVVGLGILMLGLYLVVRAMGVNVPAPPVVGRVAGKIPSGGSPRRKGNAAISRGEEVTRTSAPGRHTVSDRVRLARNERARKRGARAESQRRDEEFGGIPF